MLITPSEYGSDSVSATFNHTCGHTSMGMFYAAETYAKNDQARQESNVCWSCHNEQAIARYRREQPTK